MNTVLVVDDKELMRDSVATILTRAGYGVIVAPNGKTALRLLHERRPSLLLTDLEMPEMTGLELLDAVRQTEVDIPVVLMTAFATVATAVDAMKRGAFDYITKPFEGEQLVITIRRALEHARLRRENEVLKSQCGPRPGRGAAPPLVGRSRAMQEIRETIARIAHSQGTALIIGESGVGKEVVAQNIHAASTRADSVFLAVNCAALSPTLLESELFGHEKGAFTGADRLRKGRFELADGGTLLLDEISEIAPEIQAKLLRVLQERSFERVGSGVTRQTDVRVIATTNRDLHAAAESGAFRQDLYYRLNVLPIHVPPLRERREDIAELCAHFLEIIASREGVPARRFEPAALDLLTRYNWPGNVRELFNVCERASIFSRDSMISAATIRPWLGQGTLTSAVVAEASPIVALSAGEEAAGPYAFSESLSAVSASYTRKAAGAESRGAAADVAPWTSGDVGCEDEVVVTTESSGSSAVAIPASGRKLEDIERDVIVATLLRNNGHRQNTATELGIGVRTLGLKLKKWKESSLVDQDL